MIFRMFSRVPLFGELLRIFNTYAYRGDHRADTEFAGPWLWATAFWVPVLLSGIGMMLCMPDMLNRYLPEGYLLNYAMATHPGTLASGILPNLLGFGIGVYALVFGLHKGLLKQLQESYEPRPGEKRKPGSALVLNADMAVPLLILAVAIVVGVVQQLAPSAEWLRALSWFTLWMSFIFTIELVTTLFGLGENVVLKTLSDEKSTTPKP